MKKWLFLALFLCPLAARADILQSEREEPVSIKYAKEDIQTSTTIVLVHLSSTTVWPHKNSGALNVFDFYIGVDKLATSSGTVKLGVVTAVTTSTGDITWFAEESFTESAALTEKIRPNVGSRFSYRLRVAPNGTTPFLLSNDKTLATTTINQSRALESATGNLCFPAVGDVVLSFVSPGFGAGQIDLAVDMKYDSE